MKQRLVTLLLLAGVVGLVAFDRAPRHAASHHASISAGHRSVELPPTIETTPLFFELAPKPVVFGRSTPLVASVHCASLYLRNRRLLL